MAIMQTILSSNLSSGLHEIAAQYADQSAITSASMDNPSIIYDSSVPADLRDAIIGAYDHALHWVFIAIIPFGALMFLSTLPLRHIELAKRLQPTIAE
ncbi:hypothetical protein IW137_003429 [Coemansia sp. RSA 1287]|nr:hypothetical protein GGF45_006351 [Coemansia sp. RSA 551]KAJ2640522.1 hypothetical protein IW137_003429 [Coemansia sp. RSA 1287]